MHVHSESVHKRNVHIGNFSKALYVLITLLRRLIMYLQNGTFVFRSQKGLSIMASSSFHSDTIWLTSLKQNLMGQFSDRLRFRRFSQGEFCFLNMLEIAKIFSSPLFLLILLSTGSDLAQSMLRRVYLFISDHTKNFGF